jgi:hypothetical protein
MCVEHVLSIYNSRGKKKKTPEILSISLSKNGEISPEKKTLQWFRHLDFRTLGTQLLLVACLLACCLFAFAIVAFSRSTLSSFACLFFLHSLHFFRPFVHFYTCHFANKLITLLLSFVLGFFFFGFA